LVQIAPADAKGLGKVIAEALPSVANPEEVW
jgi:hypothetical protein